MRRFFYIPAYTGQTKSRLGSLRATTTHPRIHGADQVWDLFLLYRQRETLSIALAVGQDAYPLATYLHAKQSYSVLAWAVRRAVVLWDEVGGGLGLSKAVGDNLGRYTQALLEIARSSGQRAERERLLQEDTAARVHRWAASVAPHTLGLGQTPAVTEYGGTTFRSQLGARWADWFDRRGIAWEYEQARFDGWTPDFRLVLNGNHVYAEVNPVSELLMGVAERVLNASCNDDVLILGQNTRHAWRYDGEHWNGLDLTASSETKQ